LRQIQLLVSAFQTLFPEFGKFPFFLPKKRFFDFSFFKTAVF